MADTPRVTVPVEPTDEMLDAACNVGPDTNNGAFSYDDARTVFTAMLSAAPAPEGGAVKNWDAIRSHPCYDEHQPSCDCTALATREEAPDWTARTEAAACIREMVEWRDIETAPRDGTWILGSWGEAHPVVFGVVMWDGDQWRESDDVVSDPTHWLPLPPAPGAEDE